jgi:acetoacetyl-CoA synthetase
MAAFHGGDAEILWRPTHGGTAPMDEYRRHVNKKYNQNLCDTKELQRWSVNQPHDFWISLYRHMDLLPPLPATTKKAYDDTVPMSRVPAFFPGHELNYTENVLWANPDPDAFALIGIREDQDIYSDYGKPDDMPEIVTWRAFREKVRETASALKRSGIQRGDRVGALVATSNWAVILFHATASMGSIFTCISPELGVEGCVARLQQVSPSILFVDSHVVYKGKALSTAKKREDILRRLQVRPQVYVVPVVAPAAGTSSDNVPTTDDFLRRAHMSDKLTFVRVPVNYPLMICYSSGTTGAPKCIVHQHGLIMQVKKISSLHNGLGPGDVVMQYSSTSWVVFYVMCGHMSAGASLVVYNGSPLFPDAKQLLRICHKHRVSFLGASPRLLLEVEMSRTVPKEEFDLSALRMVYTTGAPLSIEQYRWFYRSFPPAVQICNTAGGTDTATSLLALDPCAPVYAGEMQVPALGMAVDILDPLTGESIAHTGEAGEMVLQKPFPSMPCFFWGDRDGKIYHAAYFERYDNLDVWAQHDWLSKNPKTGGYVMHGRSDGVLSKLWLIHGWECVTAD